MGDDPAGGGGAISAVNLLRLQNNGTVNSVVVRGPATAAQPVTALFRGATQAVKVGDIPLKPIPSRTYASIGPIKSMTVSLDEGVSGVLADFDATPMGMFTAKRFTNVYSLNNTGAQVSFQVSSLLDTTFVSVTPAVGGPIMSALQLNSPGTKAARTVLVYGGTNSKPTLYPATTSDDVQSGEVRAGNYFYQYTGSLSSSTPGRTLVKVGNNFLTADKVFSYSAWQDQFIQTLGRAAMSDSGSIYFEAISAEVPYPKFLARTNRNNSIFVDARVLLKEGLGAPGLNRHVISKIFYEANSFAISGGGKCVMRVAVTPTYGGRVAKEALYYVDEAKPNTTPPVLLAVAGDTIPVGTGSKTITGFDLQLVWNKGFTTGPRAINDAGQVAALVKCGTERVAFVFNTPQ